MIDRRASFSSATARDAFFAKAALLLAFARR
jgi:hypothetical protein